MFSALRWFSVIEISIDVTNIDDSKNYKLKAEIFCIWMNFWCKQMSGGEGFSSNQGFDVGGVKSRARKERTINDDN